MTGVRFRGDGSDFCFVVDRNWSPQRSIFVGVKRLERDAGHSPLFGASVDCYLLIGAGYGCFEVVTVG
jgi:hypothetical protein